MSTVEKLFIRFKGIRGKLMIPGIVQFFTFALLTLISAYFINRLGSDLKDSVNVRLPVAQYTQQMTKSVHESVRYSWSVYGAALDLEERARFLKLVEESVSSFEEALANYRTMPLSEAALEVSEPLLKVWLEFKEALDQAVAALKKNDGRFDEMAKYYLSSQVRLASEPLSLILEKLSRIRMSEQQQSAKIGLRGARMALYVLFGISTFAVLITVLVSHRIGMRIADKLASMASALGEEAESLATVAEEIRVTSASSHKDVADQAVAIQETSAAIEEISAMVGRNAENAQKSHQVSCKSQEAATEGSTVVAQMSEAMSQINSSNAEILQEISSSEQENKQIVDLINEISAKTEVINAIVFQTKLLSFNASVEAARAGENGKGFSVVAEEVGNLASMSGGAAKEISTILQNSVQRVEGISKNTRERVEKVLTGSREKVDRGSVIAKRCAEVLNVIVEDVTGVNTMMTEISDASKEQAKGIGEMTKAVGELDRVAHRSADSAQTAAQAAARLASRAENLRLMVQDLTILVHGDRQLTAEPERNFQS
ncbi:MAG TPA: hypothetical protein DCS07_09615 [Bdellovibrionales bacterium]|nr:MAG: hypothetical protein A2X97_08565 [Bdellovibrionales bacterium GWA1_52_35]OFZ40710.1 MAG: hypothetical protein A2070_08505 [Bdellovibrionales bacterium GWC1_52_8]HAR42869.1 hypothetical protein [Bdellovibrionales bacterium]HCM39787.1 hypothetical protein [Bdellovibrionales bacterium]